MTFTPEEVEYYNRLLEEGEEEQKRNGNLCYSFEEVMEKLNRIHNERMQKYRS